MKDEDKKVLFDHFGLTDVEKERKKWADEKKELEAIIQDFKEMKKIYNNIIKQQIDGKVNTSELQVEFRIKEYKANLIKKIKAEIDSTSSEHNEYLHGLGFTLKIIKEDNR